MRAYTLILAAVVLVFLYGGIGWQLDFTFDKITNPDKSNALPVSTPFTSPLCGPQNRDCKDLDLDDLNPSFEP